MQRHRIRTVCWEITMPENCILTCPFQPGRFSNRTKFYDNGAGTEFYNPDLRWDQFNQGYLLDLNYTGKVFSSDAS